VFLRSIYLRLRLETGSAATAVAKPRRSRAKHRAMIWKIMRCRVSKFYGWLAPIPAPAPI
jgi:hypothetical protein